jgi:predicted transcriptional regulator
MTIKDFLQHHTTYDVLPLSFRVIVLDTSLLVRKALAALLLNGIASAPLFDSTTHQFSGMLTMTHLIRFIHYYYMDTTYSTALDEIEKLDIRSLLVQLERYTNDQPARTTLLPSHTLLDTAHVMVDDRLRRVPILETVSGLDVIVSVMTQYRLLKFIGLNHNTTELNVKLGDVRIGVYDNLATAQLETPVIQVLHAFVERKVTAVPIVKQDGVVVNVYEKADVLNLLLDGQYKRLDMSVQDALLLRSEDFEGVHTCTLEDSLLSMMNTIKRVRVHRFIVVDERNKLVGMVSLSDMLKYMIA